MLTPDQDTRLFENVYARYKSEAENTVEKLAPGVFGKLSSPLKECLVDVYYHQGMYGPMTKEAIKSANPESSLVAAFSDVNAWGGFRLRVTTRSLIARGKVKLEYAARDQMNVLVEMPNKAYCLSEEMVAVGISTPREEEKLIPKIDPSIGAAKSICEINKSLETLPGPEWIWSNRKLWPYQVARICCLMVSSPIAAKIKLLDLSGNSLDATGAAMISYLLQQNRTLEKLILSNASLSPGCALVIAQGIRANKNIRELVMQSNKIAGEGCKAFALSVVESNVEILDLKANEITDSDVEFIAKILKASLTLRELDLSGNKITEKGAEEIAQALEFNASLKVLHISGNSIKDEGAISLSRMLEKNRSLSCLSLNDCSISQKGVSSLMAARENVLKLDIKTPFPTIALSASTIDKETSELIKKIKAFSLQP